MRETDFQNSESIEVNCIPLLKVLKSLHTVTRKYQVHV